jgi:hypothetical protein
MQLASALDSTVVHWARIIFAITTKLLARRGARALSAIGVLAHELLERFPFAAPGRLRRPATVHHVEELDLREIVHKQ